MATDSVDLGATVGTGNAMALVQSAMSELVLGSCAAAVSRRWRPRRPALALVVSSNTWVVVRHRPSHCHHSPPSTNLRKRPAACPARRRAAQAHGCPHSRAQRQHHLGHHAPTWSASLEVRKHFRNGAYAPQRMAQTIATRAALLLHRVGRTVAACGSVPVLPDRLRTDRRCFDRLGEAVESLGDNLLTTV